MTQWTFVLKNMWRRPVRSLLTAGAVAIAVASVVALVGVASGFQRTFMELYSKVGVDLIVVRADTSRRLNSTLDETLRDKIMTLPDVVEVLPALADMVAFEEYHLYGVLLQGFIPESAVFNHLEMIEGRAITKTDEKCVMLGLVLASNMHKKVGDVVKLYGEEDFKIVGIYKSFNVFENGAMIMPLKQIQRLTDQKGLVTGFSIITKKGTSEADLTAISRAVEKMEPGVRVLPTQEHVTSVLEIRLAKSMAWVTSAVALVIGSLGMINTMSMSVLERQKEIGILRAVGWKARRVVRVVILESLALSLFGAFLGILGAIGMVTWLTRLPATAGLIDGTIEPRVFLYGIALALVIGFIGGLMPAVHAARLTPTAALAHE
jgi:putative ABC transport system permease protein